MKASLAIGQAKRRDPLEARYDVVLAGAALGLAATGVVMVASSSIAIADGHGVTPFHYLARHLLFLAMGTVGALVLMRVELRLLERQAFVLLLACFALLTVVFVPGIGHAVNGSTRWVRLGVSNFQVVEAVKLFLILYMASYLVRHQAHLQTRFIGMLKPVLLTGALVGLLLLQPDFGSAILLLGIVVGMIWLGGARLRDLAAPALLLSPMLAWAALSESYRLRRLTSFLDPWSDPYRDGFQLTQALIAIGRGEWLGVGLGSSVQKLFYLPEAHTDFILAVLAEEFGLFGVLAVLVLFAVLTGRAFQLGLRAHVVGRPYAGHCAFGIALWLSLQALVSIGVNLGVLPTKGLTLPLISSGGSSVLMTCLAVGLLLRVSYEVDRAEYAKADREGRA
jgi:cell division protein FtsW